jgi:hypothetical protein
LNDKEVEISSLKSDLANSKMFVDELNEAVKKVDIYISQIKA